MFNQSPIPNQGSERNNSQNSNEANGIRWQDKMQGNPMLSNKAFQTLKAQRDGLDLDISKINDKLAELDPNNKSMKMAYEKVRDKFLRDREELDKTLGIKPTLQ